MMSYSFSFSVYIFLLSIVVNLLILNVQECVPLLIPGDHEFNSRFDGGGIDSAEESSRVWTSSHSARRSNLFDFEDEPPRLDNRMRFDEALGQRSPKCNRKIQIPNGVGRIRDKGAFVRFQCSYGFHMIGAGVAVCVKGQWSDPPPSCVKEGCRTMPIPLHGNLRQLYGGGIAVFTCNYGFLLEGERVLTCNGRNWNGTAPTCSEIPPITIAPPITTYSPAQPDPDVGTSLTTESAGKDAQSSISTIATSNDDISLTSENPITKLPNWNDSENETTLIQRSSYAKLNPELIDNNNETEIDAPQPTVRSTETTAITDLDRIPALSTPISTALPETTTPMVIEVKIAPPAPTTTDYLTTSSTVITTDLTLTPPNLNPEIVMPTEVTTRKIVTDVDVSTDEAVTITDIEITTQELSESELTTTMAPDIPNPTQKSNMYTKKPKPIKPVLPTKTVIETKISRKPLYFTKRPTKLPIPIPTSTITGTSTTQLYTEIATTISSSELDPKPDTEKPTIMTYMDPSVRAKILKTSTTDRNDVDKNANSGPSTSLEKVEIIPEKLGNMEIDDSNRYDFGHLLIVIGVTLIGIGLVIILGGILIYYWRKNKGIAHPNQYDLDGRTLSSHDGNDEFLWMDNRLRDDGL